MPKLNVIIACEESATVREEFKALGHNSKRCDLKPTRIPGNHYQGDIRMFFIKHPPHHRHLMIAHPDCTFLTGSAEWAYGDGPYHQKVKPGTLVGAARRLARNEAIEFVKWLAYSNIPKIVIENPARGALSPRWRKPDQVIQPYQFGDNASKATGLWLKGVPLLQPTDFVAGRRVIHNGKMVLRWANQTDSGQNNLGPTGDRTEKRSVTYRGIARAMAMQWGGVV